MNSRALKILLLILPLIAGWGGVASGDSAIKPQLQNFAATYFNALKSGDTGVLLTLFADNELAGIEGQLREPGYSSFLASRYDKARLEVVNSGMQDGLEFVDVIIWLNDKESVRERLMLRTLDNPGDSSYRIIDRKELDI